MKNNFLLWLTKKTLWFVVLAWCKTLRVQIVNPAALEEVKRQHKKYVLAFWHGSMLIAWFLHRPPGEQRSAALVSQSSDGEILSSVLSRWGFTMIRGSSHIGGKEAMQLMIDAVNDGCVLCITPDGPRGPRHQMKMGAVRVAQKTGAPLVLMSVAMEKKKTLRSWDKFEVPMPFSKVFVRYAEPIIVPELLDGNSLDEFLRDTEKKLQEINIAVKS